MNYCIPKLQNQQLNQQDRLHDCATTGVKMHCSYHLVPFSKTAACSAQLQAQEIFSFSKDMGWLYSSRR